MTKTASGVAGVLLAAVGFVLGYFVAPTFSAPQAPLGPPAPRSGEQAARDVERTGEIRGVLFETNPLTRIVALARLLETLGPEDIPAVAGVLRRGAVGLGGAEIDLLTQFWASYEPDPAFVWAWRELRGPMSPVGINAAIYAGAILDPEATAVRVNSARPGSQSDSDLALHALVRGWFFSGRPGVEDYLISTPQSSNRQVGVKTLIASTIQRDGLEHAEAWLEEFADEDPMLKLNAHRQAALLFQVTDREFAVAWCDRICDGPYGEYVRGQVAKSWAIEDGPAAMKWVSSAPEGEERDRAVKAAFTRWRMFDQEALIRFIDEMGPRDVEPWFVAAAGYIAMWRSWDYPLEAYEWASLIEKDDERELAFISITRRFREADEAAAEAWLEQSPLSEEARAKAREYPRNWKGRGERPYPPPPREK